MTADAPGSPSPPFMRDRAGTWLVAIAVGATLLVLFLTRHGVGLSSDSAAYVAAARQLAAGNGLSLPTGTNGLAPFRSWPPLFPTVLALGSLARLDAEGVARGLNAALFGCSLLLCGGMIRRAGSSTLPIVLVALVMLTSRDLLLAHAFAWSEPLFLVWMLLGLWALAEYLDRHADWLLIASGAAIGLAWLTRYAGVFLVASGVLALILFDKHPRRARALAWFVALSTVPMALWVARNVLVDSPFVIAAGTRSVVVPTLRPFSMAKLTQGLAAAAGWVMPSTIVSTHQEAVGAGVLTGLAVVVVSALRATASSAGHLPRVLAAFIAVYLVGALLHVSWLNASTPLDFRILAPPHVAGLLLVGCVLARGAAAARVSALPVGVLAMLVLASVAAGAGTALRVGRDGLGLRNPQFTRSQAIEWARALPDGVRRYSNYPELIYLFAGRGADMLPVPIDPLTLAPDTQYRDQIAQLAHEIDAGSAAVVYFTHPALSRSSSLTADRLLEELAGRPTFTTADAFIVPRAAAP